MDIDGLGEETINQLADAGLLKSFADVYALKNHVPQLLELERMGEKKLENLLDGIEKSKSQGLARVLTGLGVRHVGARASQMLAAHFKSIDALLAADVKAIDLALSTGDIETKKKGQAKEDYEAGVIASSAVTFLQSRVGKMS